MDQFLVAFVEYLNFTYFIEDFRHGLRTPNEGINQKYLKTWADVADFKKWE